MLGVVHPHALGFGFSLLSVSLGTDCLCGGLAHGAAQLADGNDGAHQPATQDNVQYFTPGQHRVSD